MVKALVVVVLALSQGNIKGFVSDRVFPPSGGGEHLLSGFDSLNVRRVGAWPFGPSYTVLVQGNLVFLGSGGGVVVLDVSDPSNPQRVGEIRTRGVVVGLDYEAGRLYVADGQGGLEVWDVNEPSAPMRLGSYFTPGSAEGVYVLGDYAYVAAGDGGLRILDITDPSNPYEVGYYDTPGSAWDVYVLGDYAYVAAGGGLRILDITDPTNPYEVGYYGTLGYAWDVYVLGDYAYVADGKVGLGVYEFYGEAVEEDSGESQEVTLRFLTPFALDLAFSVPQGAVYRLDLYDLQGRRVWSGRFQAGDYRVKRELPSGVYLIRLATGTRLLRQKVVVLR